MGLALVGAIFLPLPVVPFDVIDTNILLVEEATTFDEDIYVASNSGRIEGTVDGDVVIGTGDLTIDGRVTGDLFVLSHGIVRIGGTVEGSVRGAVRSIEVAGTVGGDLAVVAGNVTVTGDVGRDLLMAGGAVDLTGSVGRDVKGRMFGFDLDGAVGRDVDVTLRGLDVGPNTRVGSDLLYRADDTADIPAEAEIGGAARKLSSRGSFLVRLYLTLANAVGLILFVLIGFLALWLFRGTSARATVTVVRRPGRSLVVGAVTGVLLPFTVVFAVFLAGSALGAIVVATLVILLVLVLLTVGPVPALAALGNALTRSRAGLFGGFVIGTVIWRLASWLVPFVGALIGLAIYTWGVGSWLVASWDNRARMLAAAPLGPDLRVADDTAPVDWEPPLPPTG